MTPDPVLSAMRLAGEAGRLAQLLRSGVLPTEALDSLCLAIELHAADLLQRQLGMRHRPVDPAGEPLLRLLPDAEPGGRPVVVAMPSRAGREA